MAQRIASITTVDGIAYLKVEKPGMYAMVRLPVGEMRALHKELGEVLDKRKTERVLTSRLLARAPRTKPHVTGTEVEFVKYDAGFDMKPFFMPGDKLRIVDRHKNEQGKWVYACILSADYEKYQADPDKVDGDVLYAESIKR